MSNATFDAEDPTDADALGAGREANGASRRPIGISVIVGIAGHFVSQMLSCGGVGRAIAGL